MKWRWGMGWVDRTEMGRIDKVLYQDYDWDHH